MLHLFGTTQTTKRTLPTKSVPAISWAPQTWPLTPVLSHTISTSTRKPWALQRDTGAERHRGVTSMVISTASSLMEWIQVAPTTRPSRSMAPRRCPRESAGSASSSGSTNMPILQASTHRWWGGCTRINCNPAIVRCPALSRRDHAPSHLPRSESRTLQPMTPTQSTWLAGCPAG